MSHRDRTLFNHFRRTTAILLAVCFALPASAARQLSVDWPEMETVDFDEVIERQTYLASSSLYDVEQGEDLPGKIMADPEGRISSTFKVPPELRKNVEFWFRIYTRYSSRQTLIVDEWRPDLVYEVLDFRPIAARARNAMVYEILRDREIKAKLQRYRSAFALLERGKSQNHQDLSAELKNIARIRTQLGTKVTLKEQQKGLQLQSGQRDAVMLGLLRADKYLTMMEHVFEKFGLPSELTRLPLIESSFHELATSSAGAKGVWQFIPQSAKPYLVINTASKVDERLSPFKSTVAAAKLLRTHRKVLPGDWSWAITSYNSGFKVLKSASEAGDGSSHFARLIHDRGRKKNLGWAGRSYYSSFLAMVYAEAYRDAVFGKIPSTPIEEPSFIRLSQSISGNVFALDAGIPSDQFRRLNPDLRDLKAPLPRGLWIAVPKFLPQASSISTEEWVGTQSSKASRPQQGRRRT